MTQSRSDERDQAADRSADSAAIERERRTAIIEQIGNDIQFLGVETAHGRFLVPANAGTGRRLFIKRDIRGFEVLQGAVATVEALLGPEAIAGRTFVEIGAHFGTTTVCALRTCGFGAAVACEALAENYHLLRANLAWNDLDARVHALNVAVSDQAGHAALVTTASRPDQARIAVGGAATDTAAVDGAWDTERAAAVDEVEVTTLDALVSRGLITADRVAMVWVDVDGLEGHVLRGGRALLERGTPIVLQVTPGRLTPYGGWPAIDTEIGTGYTHFVDMRRGDGHGGSRPVHPMSDLAHRVSELRMPGESTDLLILRLDPAQARTAEQLRRLPQRARRSDSVPTFATALSRTEQQRAKEATRLFKEAARHEKEAARQEKEVARQEKEAAHHTKELSQQAKEAARRAKAERRESRDERKKPKALRVEAPESAPPDANGALGAVRARRANHPVLVSQPLVLVSQIQRSGGTLMSRLFDGHPACFSHPWELSWGGRLKSTWPSLDLNVSAASLFDRMEERWLMRLLGRGYYLKLSGGPREEAEQLPFVFDRPLQAQLFQTLVGTGRAPSARAVLDAYLTSFFNAWLGYEGLDTGPKQFVTAFTPRLVMYADHVAAFFRDYPDGYMITIVREPVSWWASAIRHQPKVYGSREHAVALWLGSARASLAAVQDHPSRVIGVLFDDLVQRTEAVMRSICQRTGLPFQPSLVTPTLNGYPVQSNSSFHLNKAVDRSTLDRSGYTAAEDAAFVREATRHVYDAARAQFAL
jgi:FkbM family methyltransferase